MASFKQPWPGATSPVHILLIALLVCEASSLLLQPAEARALDSDRKLLAQPDKVDNKNTEKIATTKELGDVRGSYWGGSGSGYNGGGGHWNGGGGYNGGGGHWNGGGGHWGGGGGGYHRGGGGCPYNGCRGGGWNQGVNKTP